MREESARFCAGALGDHIESWRGRRRLGMREIWDNRRSGGGKVRGLVAGPIGGAEAGLRDDRLLPARRAAVAVGACCRFHKRIKRLRYVFDHQIVWTPLSLCRASYDARRGRRVPIVQVCAVGNIDANGSVARNRLRGKAKVRAIVADDGLANGAQRFDAAHVLRTEVGEHSGGDGEGRVWKKSGECVGAAGAGGGRGRCRRSGSRRRRVRRRGGGGACHQLPTTGCCFGHQLHRLTLAPKGKRGAHCLSRCSGIRGRTAFAFVNG